MTRIGPRDLKPASDVEAIEDAFRFLEKSIDLGSVDDYVELRREMMVRFDEHYRTSSRAFSIDGVLSGFADNVWHFAQKVVEREGRFSRESICSAFEAFCISGELVLDQSPPESGEPIGVRDLISMASGPQVKYYLMNAEPTGVNLQNAARVILDERSEIDSFAVKMEEALSRASGGDEAGVSDLSEMIFGEELVTHMGTLSDAFQDYYFGPFINRMGLLATRAREAFEQGRIDDADGVVEELKKSYSRIKGAFDYMRDVAIAINTTIKYLKKVIDDEDALALLDRHRPFLIHFASVGHDYSNFLAAINGYLINLGIKEEQLPILKKLEEMCRRSACSTFLDLLAVVRMKMNTIRVDAEGVDNISVPEGYRRPLFRSLFELVKNAEKYRDPDKKGSQTIDLAASMNGSLLNFTVEDNGVGIEDVAKVLREGVRERPDLAKGSGLGLAGIVRMSQENGWRFGLESELGVGTKATLEVDTSGWSDGMGGSGACGSGGDMEAHDPSATGGYSTRAAVLGAQILAGLSARIV
jgi:signal transduction histidine kinase